MLGQISGSALALDIQVIINSLFKFGITMASYFFPHRIIRNYVLYPLQSNGRYNSGLFLASEENTLPMQNAIGTEITMFFRTAANENPRLALGG